MEELTVDEAAVRLGISEQAVRKRVQRGTLPHAKQGGHVYVYLDSDTSVGGLAPGAESSREESDNQITLQYIDKLFTSYRDLMSAQGRAFLTLTTLAIVLLSISGGAASAQGKLAIAGLGLRVPLAVFLAGGALLVGVLAVAVPGAEMQTEAIKREIRNLYENLGFSHWTLEGKVVNPFRVSNLREPLLSWNLSDSHPSSEQSGFMRQEQSIWEGSGDYLIHGFLSVFLTILLPIAAVIGTGFKVSELLHGHGVVWTWMLFVAEVGFVVSARMTIHFRAWRGTSAFDEIASPYLWLMAALPSLSAASMGIGLGYLVAKVLGSG